MRLPFAVPLPDRRRATSFVLALAVEAALIALLLTFGPHFIPAPSKPVRQPSTFSLRPSDEQAMTSPDRRAAKAATKPSAQTAAKTPPPPPPPPVVQPSTEPAKPWNLKGVLPIKLGARNIGELKSSAPPASDTGPDEADSQLAKGPGLAPDGQPYYMADWYRRPTQAEIVPFLPKRLPDKGWGLIMCKTAARYRVEDCRVVSEYPAGSGLARAAVQMSWQFLMRPPRKGGQALLGKWVGIRFDYATIYVRGKDKPAGPDDDQPEDDKSGQ